MAAVTTAKMNASQIGNTMFSNTLSDSIADEQRTPYDTDTNTGTERVSWREALAGFTPAVAGFQPGEDPRETYNAWYWQHITSRGIPTTDESIAEAKNAAREFRAASADGEAASNAMRIRDNVWTKARSGAALTKAELFTAANNARMSASAVRAARELGAAWDALQASYKSQTDSLTAAWLNSDNK